MWTVDPSIASVIRNKVWEGSWGDPSHCSKDFSKKDAKEARLFFEKYVIDFFPENYISARNLPPVRILSLADRKQALVAAGSWLCG